MVVFQQHVLAERNGIGKEQPPPMTWDYAYDDPQRTMPLSMKRALAWGTCPNGHSCTIVADVHSIAADGTLTPSYVCPVPECGFHDWVRFYGWEGER
jgi:hypothetical protein